MQSAKGLYSRQKFHKNFSSVLTLVTYDPQYILVLLCNMQHATKPSATFLEIAVYTLKVIMRLVIAL
jgi:hypothetical protein